MSSGQTSILAAETSGRKRVTRIARRLGRDPETVARDIEQTLRLEAPSLDLLLHEWMSELILLKDSDRLIFPDALVSVRAAPPTLTARVTGGCIERTRTILRADPKAVTFHQFALERRGGGWYARVVIDI